MEAIDALGAADGDMRWAVRSSLPVEMAVIRLTQGAGGPALTAHPPATCRPGERRHGPCGGHCGLDSAHPATGGSGGALGRRRNADGERSVGRKRAADDQRPGGSVAAPESGACRAVRRRRGQEPTPDVPDRGAFAGVETRRDIDAVSAAGRGRGSGGRSRGRRRVRRPMSDWPAVLAHWDTLHRTLRERRHLDVQAFLREGTARGSARGRLLIEFPADRGFHRASLDTDANRRILEGILRPLVGWDVKVTTSLVGEQAAGSGRDGARFARPRPAHEPPEDPTEHEAVKEALRVFGGKIVGVERRDG